MTEAAYSTTNYSVPQASSSAVRLLSYQELDILHSLRGFCAFYVVVYHAKFVLWSGGASYLAVFPRNTWGIGQYLAFAADMLSSAGYEMVIFFFVLSGFFIRYAQLRKYRPAAKFYLNRLVRIYPPFLASLVLGGLVISYLAAYHAGLFTDAIGRELNSDLLVARSEAGSLSVMGVIRVVLFERINRYYLGYNIVYWSLLPEALFYLAVPLAFWRIRAYYILSAAFYAFGMVATFLHVSTGEAGDFVFIYNGYFALGVAMYDLVTLRPGWLERFRRTNGYWLALAIWGLLALLIALAAIHLRAASSLVSATLAVLLISAMLAGRINRRNIFVRSFHEVGIFSFSLYLYHFPLLLLCYAGLAAYTGHLVSYARYYWIALPFVTGICYCLYCVTEKLAVRYFRGL